MIILQLIPIFYKTLAIAPFKISKKDPRWVNIVEKKT